MTTSRPVSHQRWVARCPPRIPDNSHLKTIPLAFMIHYCYCLMASGKRKEGALIFSVKMLSFWGFLLSRNCVPGIAYILYILLLK